MKLTILLLLAAILQGHAKTSAQNITYTASGEAVSIVLAAIEKQTGYGFFYKKEVLDDRRIVSVSWKNTPLLTALEGLLKDQPMIFTARGKTIFITRGSILTGDKTVASTIDFLPVTGIVRTADGRPLEGATITVKGKKTVAVTGKDGRFSMMADAGTVLIVSFVGFESRELKVVDGSPLIIVLVPGNAKMDTAIITLSTGYQHIPPERATGSFVQLGNDLLNRAVSTNLIDRLNGVTNGAFFTPPSNSSTAFQAAAGMTNPLARNLGIRIRGESTLAEGLQVSKDPLIVLDDFPYEGDLNNINPNNIETITVLKDAAASSIWGARAGNGVIVITTKKGRINQLAKIDFNSNLTVRRKPDLLKDKSYLPAAEYIEVEQYLFDKGYYNASLTNDRSWPAVNPAVEIMSLRRSGGLSPQDADAQLNALKSLDAMREYDRYIYQRGANQQYSLGVRGGTHQLSYAFSAGFDKNIENMRGLGLNRLTLSNFTTYKPTRNLEVVVGINYGINKSFFNSLNNSYQFIYPYFKMADDNGNPLPMVRDYRTSYVKNAASLGFLDWQYRPLQELELADRNVNNNNLLLKAGIKYKIRSYLGAEIQFQNEQQQTMSRDYRSIETYEARDIVNRFSVYNGVTKSISYQLPVGGMLDRKMANWNANNLRGQLNFDHIFKGDHSVNAIAGAEFRELKTEGFNIKLYGYNDDLGTSAANLNYSAPLVTNPSGSAFITAPDNAITGFMNRFASFYANGAYTYKQRYTLSLSARKDGANIFGAATNDKFSPLWSAGVSWEVNREAFYKLSFLPYLRLRGSYGYSGNAYQKAVYTTGIFLSSELTGASGIANLTAPNPSLSWEKIKTINFGVDFTAKNNVLSGSLEIYRKEGIDLIQSQPIAPSIGFREFIGNSAGTRTIGVDLMLNGRINLGRVKWQPSLILNTVNDKVTEFNRSKVNISGTTATSIGIPGRPLYSLFSYKWAGLDPVNGDPQGYLNGKVSKDYATIAGNVSVDSLVFHGSQRPTVFGAFRNDFTWKAFSVSFNIVYKFNYYLRRPSVSLNYTDVVASSIGRHLDYLDRWQKPGDENLTDVPSLVYPSNAQRNNFYKFSEILVEKGDHIRLQDLRIGYTIPGKQGKRSSFERVQLYTYINNIGILWRANKSDIDPDAMSINMVPVPLAIAGGVSINF